MTIKDQITEQIKTAMKAGDKFRCNVLRMILSDLKYAQSAVSMHDVLDQSAELKAVSGYYKKLQKAIVDYPETSENRLNLTKEMAIVAEFLPKSASREDIERLVKKILLETSERNFGILMKKAMSELGESVDGKMLSEVLKADLAKIS